MPEQRIQQLGDRFGQMVEDETGVSLGLNFGLARNALHDAIATLPDADDDAILQRALHNLRDQQPQPSG